MLCAISLDAARRSGDAGLGVEGEGFFNGQGKIAVAGCRDKSRLVGGHEVMITRRTMSALGYPHHRRRTGKPPIHFD